MDAAEMELNPEEKLHDMSPGVGEPSCSCFMVCGCLDHVPCQDG